MKTKHAWYVLTVLTVMVMVLGLLPQAAKAAPASAVTFTICITTTFMANSNLQAATLDWLDWRLWSIKSDPQ